MSIIELKYQLEELENKLENVTGKETEVYARIVGYYRSVSNWNIGKSSEYKQRMPFMFKGVD